MKNRKYISVPRLSGVVLARPALSCAPVWYFLLSVYFQSSPIQELSAMSTLEYLGNPPIAPDHQPRTVRVAAAQLGPIARQENREQVVERLTALLQQAAEGRACSAARLGASFFERRVRIEVRVVYTENLE